MALGCALAAALSTAAARADTLSSGTTISVGVGRLQRLAHDDAVRTRVPQNTGTQTFGIPAAFDSPAAGLQVRNTETLAITLSQTLSRRWLLELDVGLPPILRVSGRGTVEVPTRAGPMFAIDLAEPDYQPLGKARQWAPALQLQYQLLGECRRFCPYLGAGATYAWFTNETLDADFAARLNSQYGAQLALFAGKPGATTSQAKVKGALRPAFASGVRSALGRHWGLTMALGYVPFTTAATVTIRAADGSTLSRTTDRVKVDGLVASLLLGYSW